MTPKIEVSGIEGVQSFLKQTHGIMMRAATQSVNDVAIEMQKGVTKDLLPSKFTLRGKGRKWFEPGMALGFNIKFANKSRPEAVFGSRAPWNPLQEEGGTKQVQGHRISLPVTARASKSDLIPARLKPKRLRAGGKGRYNRAFYAVVKNTAGIWEREGKKRTPIVLIYALRQLTNVPAKFGFHRMVKDVMSTRINEVYKERLWDGIYRSGVDMDKLLKVLG